MAKTIQVINGHQLIGDVETVDVADEAIVAAKLATDAVTTTKILDSAITVGKLDPSLLKYLLSVARVDYGHVGYCKVG